MTDQPALRLSIETRTYQNMGDHAERLTTSHVAVEGETVEDLVRRVFRGLSDSYRNHDLTDEVVIRVQANADGTPAGQVTSTLGAPW